MDGGNEADSAVVCVVCLDPCSESMSIDVHGCRCGGIIMHEACQKQWRDLHDDCPVCRTPTIIGRSDPPIGSPIQEVEAELTRIGQSPLTDTDQTTATINSSNSSRTQVGGRGRRRPVSWYRVMWECCLPSGC